MPLIAKNINGIQILTLNRSDFTLDTSKSLREKVIELIYLGAKKFIIDLTRVTSMDVTGAGALITLLKMVGSADNIVLCTASQEILRTLQFTKLQDIFTIQPDVNEAIEYLSD